MYCHELALSHPRLVILLLNQVNFCCLYLLLTWVRLAICLILVCSHPQCSSGALP